MTRQNCWEYFHCGRETGGTKIQERGICPAAVDAEAHGLNNGQNGGRICWAIAGTLCDGEAKGSNVNKDTVCADCDFYKKVKAEEGFLEYRILKPEQLK
jgi:hypothetical protein